MPDASTALVDDATDASPTAVRSTAKERQRAIRARLLARMPGGGDRASFAAALDRSRRVLDELGSGARAPRDIIVTRAAGMALVRFAE